jgi:hypothetical protein
MGVAIWPFLHVCAAGVSTAAAVARCYNPRRLLSRLSSEGCWGSWPLVCQNAPSDPLLVGGEVRVRLARAGKHIHTLAPVDIGARGFGSAGRLESGEFSSSSTRVATVTIPRSVLQATATPLRAARPSSGPAMQTEPQCGMGIVAAVAQSPHIAQC